MTASQSFSEWIKTKRLSNNVINVEYIDTIKKVKRTKRQRPRIHLTNLQFMHKLKDSLGKTPKHQHDQFSLDQDSSGEPDPRGLWKNPLPLSKFSGLDSPNKNKEEVKKGKNKILGKMKTVTYVLDRD